MSSDKSGHPSLLGFSHLWWSCNFGAVLCPLHFGSSRPGTEGLIVTDWDYLFFPDNLSRIQIWDKMKSAKT